MRNVGVFRTTPPPQFDLIFCYHIFKKVSTGLDILDIDDDRNGVMTKKIEFRNTRRVRYLNPKQRRMKGVKILQRGMKHSLSK